jgi:hypothetical protein
MQASPSPFRRALGLLLALALGGPLRAQSQPLEGLLIVASTDEGPLDRDRRRKLATLATTMAHLDKGQFNPINFIPPGQPPTMFVPIAAPTGRILLYTYDDKQPDAAKREELRIGLPFNGLSYQLTPPFHRFGDPNDFHLRNLSISTTRSAGSRRWRWSPDGQRLFLVLGGDRWITSGGGAREITFTGSVPNGYLEGFAQDANHVLLYSQPPGAKPRWYTARLPERQASVDLATLFASARQVPFGEEATGENAAGGIIYSPDGRSVAFVATSRKLANSEVLFAGPPDNPRQVFIAQGLRSSADTGQAPASLLGQDVGGPMLRPGQPYRVKFGKLLILGWSQDGGTLYFCLSEQSGQGITESSNPQDHRVQHTNQIWSWRADRGAAKVMDLPVMTYYPIVGCPISHDGRWLLLWGHDLPGSVMTSREHAVLTNGSTSTPRHLYAADLRAGTVRKIWRQGSFYDYATFTKPQQWEGEVNPGFTTGPPGQALPDSFLRFTSPVTVKPWQYQWAFELNFEGSAPGFARRRDSLFVEATFARPDGAPYRDTDGDYRTSAGLAASFLPFRTAILSVSADAFRGTYFVPWSVLELLAAQDTPVDVVLRLYEGDRLLGETVPPSRVTIPEADASRVWFKAPKVALGHREGRAGLVVTAEAHTFKLAAWGVRLEALVRDANLAPVAARDVAFRGPGGTAAAKSAHALSRDDEVVPVDLFIPLEALQLPSGLSALNIQLQAIILDRNFVGGSLQLPITVRIP